MGALDVEDPQKVPEVIGVIMEHDFLRFVTLDALSQDQKCTMTLLIPLEE